jgi:hypothetical protein
MVSEYAVIRPQILCKPVEVPTFHNGRNFTTKNSSVESTLCYCLTRI